MISSDVPLLSVDDLADQVAEVLDFFGYLNDFFTCLVYHLFCHEETLEKKRQDN